mmetsp:Transcript_22072/g.41599  ORF Transcript_22072/g.41599 Transcript_22072/m.41599 type:complete len:80 (+) Transcript_22072:1033-1272(+)
MEVSASAAQGWRRTGQKRLLSMASMARGRRVHAEAQHGAQFRTTKVAAKLASEAACRRPLVEMGLLQTGAGQSPPKAPA